MGICQIRLREEGKAYPRTCPTCKLGPCQEGQDYAGLTARIRNLEAIIPPLIAIISNNLARITPEHELAGRIILEKLSDYLKINNKE